MDALKDTILNKAILHEAIESQGMKTNPKLGPKPKPNDKPGKMPTNLESTGETTSNSPTGLGESVGSKSSHGDINPPKYDAVGQPMGSGPPLEGDLTCLDDKWWRVQILFAHLNQIGVDTPHTRVFLFCLFFPRQAKCLMSSTTGLEVYVCHFNISFKVPSDMFCMLTKGNCLEQDSMELSIDNEWALYGAKVDACNPLGVSYQHKDSMAGALHGQATKPEVKADNTGQTEAQLQQTKDFLREM